VARKATIENLQPFKKGQSGNPNGRPKKLPELDKLLANVLGEENANGVTAAEAILMALRAKAAKGDIRAAEVLLDRGYGKAKQSIDLNADVTSRFTMIDDIQPVPPPIDEAGAGMGLPEDAPHK
jgi:hypothetical protein